MRYITGCVVGLLLTAGAALADAHSNGGAKIYPVHTKHNYCPAGLQPVSMDGTICCGTPNQHMSYSKVMAQHSGYKAKRRHSARAHCAAGVKGCS